MKKLLLFIVLLGGMTRSHAQDEVDTAALMMEYLKSRDSVEKTLNYKTGTIILGDGVATINVPKGFKFLESKDADRVLYDLWGNPKSEAPLGILFPDYSGAMDPGGYAFVIKFENIGYVKDKDANKIDYDDLLKDIKEGEKQENIERQNIGAPTMEIVGWAATPYYDQEKKLLHWAKEFKVEGEEENTLNYDVRVLGRRGVLTLQAISTMNEFDSVNKSIDKVLSMVSFNSGHAYSDFDSKTDDVAAWTIGGLVAGKVLAKAGFFALVLKNIKLVLLGLVAAGGFIWRFITGRRKKEEEFEYAPSAPVNQPNDTPPTV